MRETHDLPGWLEQLSAEEERLADPALAPAEAGRCILHIANIAEHIKRLLTSAIHQWNIGRQFDFFIDDLRVRKHTAFVQLADVLAAKSLSPEAEPRSVLAVSGQFREQLRWLLEEINLPQWHETTTDQVIAEPSTADLEELPIEAIITKMKARDHYRSTDQAL